MSSLFSDPKKPTAFSIRVEGMASDSCVERVEKAIRATPGVVSVTAAMSGTPEKVTSARFVARLTDSDEAEALGTRNIFLRCGRIDGATSATH
jgi:copper chaperone CopZ